ncbi:proline-rich protein 36 [Engraulis encrasicolus]|uniref:proline-rich protein 36 n=1 Tax=Engraulis encrasicolus TaxID=184585 RepID=UPI002FD72C79
MASNSPLRQQNHARPHQGLSGILKPHNEQCKATGSVKGSKVNTAQHGSKRGGENQDPSTSTQKAASTVKLKGLSRLPVLAKTFQPQPTSDSILKKWEERPLLSKDKRKKKCTKPQPFNFSQPRATRLAGQNPSVPQRGTVDTKNLTAQPTPSGSKPSNAKKATDGFCPDPSALRSILLSEGVAAASGAQDATPRPSGRGTSVYMPQRVPMRSAQRRKPEGNTGHVAFVPDAASLGSILRDEGIQPLGGATPYTSTCPPARHTSIYTPQRVPVKSTQKKQPEAKAGHEAFVPDAASLGSILRDEGIQPLGGATPHTSTCPPARHTSIYTAQRVPVSKPRTVTASSVKGSAVTFSPDPTALRSILQNEGVQPGGATPLSSATLPPTGRTTSLYKAQRVPVTKPRIEKCEALKGPGRVSPGVSPQKGTPQRVPCTQPRSMKRLLSAYRRTPKLTASPCLKGEAEPSPVPSQGEDEVVKMLFEEEEEEMMKSGEAPLQASQQAAESQAEVLHRPFIQSLQRESVIVLSSGLRLFGGAGTPARPPAEPPTALPTPVPPPDLPTPLAVPLTTTAFLPPAPPTPLPLPQPAPLLPTGQPAAVPLSLPTSIPPPGPCATTAVPAAIPPLSLPTPPPQPPSTVSCDAEAAPSLAQLQCPPCPSEAPVARQQDSLLPPLPTGLKSAFDSVGSVGRTTATPGNTMALCQKRVRELRAWGPSLEEVLLDEECATFMSLPLHCAAPPRCLDPLASTLLTQDNACFIPIEPPCLSPATYPESEQSPHLFTPLITVHT